MSKIVRINNGEYKLSVLEASKNITLHTDIATGDIFLTSRYVDITGFNDHGYLTTANQTFDLLNTTASTVNAFGAATAITMGATTGTTTIRSANTIVVGDLAVNGGDITSTSSTFNLLNQPTTVTAFYNATSINIGDYTSRSGRTITLNADLIVNGSTTTLNTTTMTVDDINIILGDTGNLSPTEPNYAIPTDISAQGGGITLKGSTDKTIEWWNYTSTIESPNIDGTGFNPSWALNQSIDIPFKYTYQIDRYTVLSRNSVLPYASSVEAFRNAQTVNMGSSTAGGILTIFNPLTELKGDLRIDGTEISTPSSTFNLLNTVVTTVNAFGAATAITIGSTTGTTTIRSATTVASGDLAVNGGDMTTIATTFNMLDTTATTVNAFRAATALTIGATTGTTTIRNANTIVTGDLAVNGGDMTTTQSLFNLLNTTATTINAFGAATAVSIGTGTGTTTINHDLSVNGGDLITNQSSFNLLNQPTTINAFGAATAISIGAGTGTTTINHDLSVNGGDLVTNQTTFRLINDTATTVNAFGSATNIIIGAGTGVTTINHDLSVNGGDISTTTSNFNVLNQPTTITAFSSGTSISMGSSSAGTFTIHNTSTVLDGDLSVNGGDLTTSQATFNLLNTTATTVNAFGNATAISIGAGSGTTTINHDLAINGGDMISNQATFNLLNQPTTVNAFEAGTNITIGATTGTLTLRNPTINTLGDVVVAGDLAVNGGDITTTATSVTVFNTNATTANIFGSSTAISMGAATGTTTLNHDLSVNGGDLLTNQSSFNLLNQPTTITAFSAGTSITIGALTGTTTIRNANTVLTGDLAVNGGDITTTSTTASLFNTTATTIDAFGASTNLTIGSTTGIATIRNATTELSGNLTIDGTSITMPSATVNVINQPTNVTAFNAATTLSMGGTGTGSQTTINSATTNVTDLAVNGGDLTTNQSSFNLLNTTATTINAFGAATSISVGAATGTTTIHNSIAANYGSITSTSSTFALLNQPTTVNAFTGATAVTIGASGGVTTIAGDLIVNGTTTTVNSTTVTIDDKNIELGSVASPSDGGANGGGITLKGTTDKTFNWDLSTGSWTSSENINVISGKNYEIGGIVVLTSSSILPNASSASIGAVGSSFTFNGDITTVGDIAINGGDLITNQSTFNLLNTTATMVNAFGAGNNINIGSTSGSTTIRTANTILSGTLTVNGSTVALNGSNITSTSATVNVLADNATTAVNLGGSSTKVTVSGILRANTVETLVSTNSGITATTTTITPQIVDSFSKLLYRSAKYVIQMSSTTNYHTTEISVIHNGTNADTVSYLDNVMGSSCGTFTAQITGNNVELVFTPLLTNVGLKIVKTVIAI